MFSFMTSSSTNSTKRGKVVGFNLDNINRKRGGWHRFIYFCGDLLQDVAELLGCKIATTAAVLVPIILSIAMVVAVINFCHLYSQQNHLVYDLSTHTNPCLACRTKSLHRK